MTWFKCKVVYSNGRLWIMLPDNRDLETPNEPHANTWLKGEMKTYDNGNSFMIAFTEFEDEVDMQRSVIPEAKK